MSERECPPHGTARELVRRRVAELEAAVAVRDAAGNVRCSDGVTDDTAVLKRADEALRESEARYRMLFERNLAGVYRTTTDGRVLDCNESFARMIGQGSRDDVLSCNARSFYLDGADRDAFVAELKERGAVTNRELQLRRADGTPVWIVENASLIHDDAGDGAATVIQGTMIDVTERKRAEQELRRSYERLRGLLGEAVNALASAIELRDPYTAGHQRGVAQLACAIAEEMGFSDDQIDGIRMAAQVHDVGKISVPAEILSKPGELSETQLGLIRSHPETGHEVLSSIDFPWPVAEIVLQHHERLDGSGYPKGLKGDEILSEAKVLAVADVVEAVTSHRPYRAASSTDAALEELTRHRGTLYAPDVVDACVRLFRERGFSFGAQRHGA
jgi:PAS domain S-box-containing protein